MVHGDAELACFLVQLHGEVGGFLVERMRPVEPAAANTIGGHQIVQVAQEVVGQVVPEVEHSILAAALVQILEQLAIGGNELSAGYHACLLKKRDVLPPVIVVVDQHFGGEGRALADGSVHASGSFRRTAGPRGWPCSRM